MELHDGRLILSPSDLNDFRACRHKAALDLRRARGERQPKQPRRPDADVVARKGEEHEAAFLDRLRAEGRKVVEIPRRPTADAVAQTEAAMRAGADVVFQAAFAHDGWQGYADFVVRIDAPSRLGPWSYEAYDTKLARHPKPYFVLQLAFYSEGIGRVQGWVPRQMHVVLGDHELRSFAYADFAAYVRRVRAEFEAQFASGALERPPYPYPVAHCDYCPWWADCADRRRADDHLSLVAGLGRGQTVKLEDAAVPTLSALAELPDGRTVDRLAAGTLAGLRLQARLQAHTRATGEPVHELLALEDGRGLARLPAPSPGDVFFDLEGDPYWGEDGLEYLWGSTTHEGHRVLWAHSRDEERQAFEAWVDWITARLAVHPDLHVYHYNHYEPTTLKKLMSRYGTREHEVDELLRRAVFVDLYAVVRQALRIGEESYSIKRLERFYPFERDADVTDAGGSILAYQEWLEHGGPATLRAIAEYNRDDCASTLALRDWLLDLREEARDRFGAPLPDRDAKPATGFSDRSIARHEELERLREALLADPDDSPRALLADLLEYHRREAKPGYWAYFERLERDARELCAEDAEAIGGLTPTVGLERVASKQSWLIPLAFPPQQHKLKPGQVVDPDGERPVNLERIDEERGVVWIKRGKRAPESPLPSALVPGRPFPQRAQQDALRRLAGRVIAHGVEPRGELDAACDLLAARAPRVHDGGAGGLAGRVAALADSALFVQGPPGSGKTTQGADLVVDALARGERVGIAAVSHEAIHNLLRKVETVAEARGVPFRGLKKASEDNPGSGYESDRITSTIKNEAFPPGDDVRLVAGTAWLFAREEMTAQVDLLLVDEAGQVSLADALALASAARNVVLLGDPQQLPHVSQGTHPRGSGASVLAHLLGDAATVPPERGEFLASTYRLHPEICAFVSEVMYDGRLETAPACARQRVDSPGVRGAGLRWLAVPHGGNTQTAEEEAEAIAAEVARLLDGGTWTDGQGRERPLTLADVLVVAPYNAQVRALRARLPAGARVGTVDKFQGQEAPVVFFSMTSSSGEDVPRGMDFLFSRNRLNVAVSRAQCLAVVVCSPALLTAPCSSVEQMRLVNALCRFVELAEEGERMRADGHRADGDVDGAPPRGVERGRAPADRDAAPAGRGDPAAHAAQQR